MPMLLASLFLPLLQQLVTWPLPQIWFVLDPELGVLELGVLELGVVPSPFLGRTLGTSPSS